MLISLRNEIQQPFYKYFSHIIKAVIERKKDAMLLAISKCGCIRTAAEMAKINSQSRYQWLKFDASYRFALKNRTLHSWMAACHGPKN